MRENAAGDAGIVLYKHWDMFWDKTDAMYDQRVCIDAT